MNVYACMCMHVYVCIHVCVHLHVGMHVCVYACMFAYVCAKLHVGGGGSNCCLSFEYMKFNMYKWLQ